MKRIRLDAKSFLWGTALAAAASALSFLAYSRRPYYTAVLLPSSMAACLLVAWLLYLRSDGLARKHESRVGGVGSGNPGTDGVGVGENPGNPGGSSKRVRRAFLWAALELAVLSVALYYLAGLGARYFG